ncbi:MAG: DUF533 domain-containing protein [Acidimicrobiia bacterium]|nr:DUF533 domain-containing protein [Acidimicrobiia bacterium]
MVKVPEGYRSKHVNDQRTAGGGRSRGGSDLLGGMLGGNAAGGSLLGTIGKMALPLILSKVMRGGSGRSGGGLGGLLGSMLGGGNDNEPPKLTDEERNEADDQATLLLRAMINGAKADGQVDKDELDKIVKRLGDIDEHEAAFLRAEFEAPLDIAAFCATVPEELDEEVYAFSLMGMKLDTQREAQFLGAMAQGLNMDPRVCNEIHEKLGVPEIFS